MEARVVSPVWRDSQAVPNAEMAIEWMLQRIGPLVDENFLLNAVVAVQKRRIPLCSQCLSMPPTGLPLAPAFFR